MKKVLAALAIVMAGFFLAPLTLDLADRVIAGAKTTASLVKAYDTGAIPKVETNLATPALSPQGQIKVVTLEARNMVLLKGPVTGSSVSKLMKQLRTMSRELSKDTPIYLVLDTPGGSIYDGLDLIDFAKALPQKVHTISLFAASMGFQIAQNLDTRYIARTGQLMSHRATVGGVGGQIKGEFESRYKMYRRSVDYLDFVASQRMGIDAKAYDQLIFNEYWVYGFDAVAEKAADEQVLVKCGATLDGSDDVEYDTIFGPITVTFSKCPLIKAPEKIDLGKIGFGEQAKARDVINMALNDEREFVKEYITTNRFAEVFK